MRTLRVLDSAELGDEPASWPVLRHQVLAEGWVAEFVNDTVQAPDGSAMDRQYTLHPGAVGVIALNGSDQLAVVRQYRHPVGYRLIEPPAGLLDHDGEDPLIAAQRELAEEAGLAAGRWQVLLDLFTSPGASQESLRIYLATDLTPAGAPEGFVAESEEAVMELAWADRAGLVEAVLAGKVQNPVMVSGLLALEVARSSGCLNSLRDARAAWPARQTRAEQNARLVDDNGH